MSMLVYQRAPKHSIVCAQVPLSIVATATSAGQKSHVVTFVEPELRSMIDLAASELFVAVHANSIEAACRAMQALVIGTLLISPTMVSTAELTDVRRLVQESPGALTVGVVRKRSPEVEGALLMLGRCGVRTVVNLSEREGLNALRRIASHPGDRVSVAILTELQSVLSEVSPVTAKFFTHLIRISPVTLTVRQLRRTMGMRPSTVSSRLWRLGAPSLKTYLAMFRLLHLAGVLEDKSLSIAQASYLLHYSSPQAVVRHTRHMLGVTAGRFREKWTFDSFLRHVVGRLFTPFYKEFQSFIPFNAGAPENLSLPSDEAKS